MYLHQNFQLLQLIECGYLGIIEQRQLVTKQNIDSKYYEGRTPLHTAIISGQIKIAKQFMTLKPDLSVKDDLGLTAVDWLRIKIQDNEEFEKIAKLLPEELNIKEEIKIDEENLTVLRAAQLGVIYLEPFFSKAHHKYNPFLKDRFGRKAIHYAAISGNLKTFEFLKQHKFSPQLKDNFGLNAYHYICTNEHNNIDKSIQHKSNLKHFQTQNHYDVIIIGSGAAGIGAGLTLSRNGLKYLVLQARDRIGGRILSQSIDQVELDLGACWVHSYSKQNPICKEVKNLKWSQRKSTPVSDPLIVSQLKPNLSYKQIDQCRYLYMNYFAIVQQKALIAKQDLSIQEAGRQFYQKNISTLPPVKKALVDMFINMTEHYNASTIGQLSAKYFQEQQDRGGDFCPQGSYEKLLKAIAQQVKFQEKVKFKQQIQSIEYSKEKQYCAIKTKDGNEYFAKKVISSIPLGILKKNIVKFIPDLPQIHQQCIQKLGWGVMNKVIVSFQKPFWKQNPSWIRIACEQKGKYPAIYNFSNENKHILCCFITDNFAQSISLLTDQQILEDFISTLRRSFNKQEIVPIDYVITRWDKDPYSMGSYTHFDVNSNIETTRKLRKNIDQKLWIAGQHCYGEHIGCAHGAFQTGIWAAQEVLELFKKVQFW